MKKKYFLILLSACLCACSDSEVIEPDFEITLPKLNYAVNEPVIFNFTGTADIITFYSGQKGREFEFRERVKVKGIPQMSFKSNRQFGNTSPTVIDTSLKIMTSTNFKGIYNAEYVTMATWKNITDRAILPVVSRATPDVFSGVIDLSDQSTLDSSLYIAFKYNGSKTAFSQYQWIIKEISIDNKLEDGSLANIKTSATLSWAQVDILNPTKIWTFAAAQITMTGGPANEPDNEDWIISQPLELDRVQRSLGVAVRTSPLAKIPSYKFAGYSAPGTYKVTFEVLNANKFGSKAKIKEFLITVE
ncbi:MAG TPA: DUF5017 domain-containing protein [Pedobacter sp.]|uniref:DUF5017 domain-containing protein n=1 Tax=Pedobacter sp. TaxID=1411316 RepID=UPI002D13ABDE|nr:DUF5017 domain-containing protein [Pedobacter sp.]HMI02105.1 DUF5017 domain-containing protein [Pedobacter sp.]